MRFMIKIHKTLIRNKDFHTANISRKGLSEPRRKYIKEYNNQIKEGKIEYKSIPCLCGYEDFDLVASVDRYGIIQKTVICKYCGLLQSNPRMSQSAYKNFYESDLYRKIYTDTSLEEYTKLKFSNDSGFNSGKEIFDIVLNKLSTNEFKDILDFGGGGGWNLAPFKSAGMNVTGIEYSPRLVELGRLYGINMIQGGFDTLHRIDESYDLILLNHVLEHFIDPFDKLKRLINHLTPTGYIYFGLPNIMNFGIYQLQNAHVYYFNPSNFKYFVESTGLQMIEFGSTNGNHMYGIFKNAKIIPSQEDLVKSRKRMYRKIKSFFYRNQIVIAPLKKFGLYHTIRNVKHMLKSGP